MGDLERVLKLRPANIVERLGARSTLPVLEPGRLERALAGRGGPLLCAPISSLASLPGVLRAARELDAVIGLSCPGSLSDPFAASSFIEALRAEGEELHRKPLFLQAGPIRIASIDGGVLNLVFTTVHKLVWEGFSLISLDASRLGVTNNVHVCRDLIQATAGKALSIELTAPRAANGRVSAQGLRHYLQALDKEGVRPRFVRLESRSPDGTGEELPPLDAAQLGELHATASSFQVSLSMPDQGRASLSQLAAWAKAGIRKLDAESAFARLVLPGLPEAVREELAARARQAELPLAAILGPSELAAVELSAAARERIEANSYAEAIELLQALGASGSAAHAVDWLIEHGKR